MPLATDLQSVPQIGFVVALAVADVLLGHGILPQLKWPNDVLVEGAKIAGILCEVLSTEPLTIALGCGINVAHAPAGLTYPATCLAAEGATTNRDAVFQSYGDALSYWLNKWNNGHDFPDIRDAWIKRAIGIGEIVTMDTGKQTLTGTFETITEQGAIMLKPADSPPQILHAGDLHIPSLARLRNGTS
jgi:BirA family transcriptional regulator, biotin operon repressor / biotin---[acetyl-CoA-carboxylase] ligase